MDRIEKLNEFLKEQPNDPFLLHALAMEYLGTGNSKEATVRFESIVREHPTYVASYYQLGQLLEKAGEEENAIATYQAGMKAAEAAGDLRSLGELRSAYEELTF